jgi:hypothetical protein
MNQFTTDDAGIIALADAFFINDPYYPRPRKNDVLYESFKAAYLRACSSNLASWAEKFLDEIENRQAERDDKLNKQ